MRRSGGLFRRYVLDTSFFSDMWAENGIYARDRHAGLWRHFEEQVERDEIIAPKEVREELEGCFDEELDRWLVEHGSIFLEVHSVQLPILTTIVRKYPSFTLGKKNLADPAVVSLAAAEKLPVLTGERYQTTPSARSPKIPNLCEQLGVDCYDVNAYLRAEELVL